jgi:hypothetical protein
MTLERMSLQNRCNLKASILNHITPPNEGEGTNDPTGSSLVIEPNGAVESYLRDAKQ